MLALKISNRLILLFFLANLQALGKEKPKDIYYIILESKQMHYDQYDRPQKYISKLYTHNQCFTLTYNCNCYARNNNLKFIYEGKNVKTLTSSPKSAISIDSFADIVNQKRKEFKNIYDDDFYIVEKVSDKLYLCFKVKFLPIENDE